MRESRGRSRLRASIVATRSSHRAGLSLLLDLVRLRINECDFQAAYAAVIAEQLRTSAGQTLQVAAIADADNVGPTAPISVRRHLR